jgi:hypothetical protein
VAVTALEMELTLQMAQQILVLEAVAEVKALTTLALVVQEL